MDSIERLYRSHSARDTRKLGQQIGERLTAGSILLLSGDLGSGKTVIVQGLARGMAVPDNCYVNSPTYTLINEYPARLPFFHVDLYRLNHGADIEEIGLMELLSPPNVVAIEWSERLQPSEVPEEHLKIDLSIENEFIRAVRLIAYGLKMVSLVKDMPIC